ncbi:10278_t:CDS:2, partial [Gigaspora margarita]
MANKQSKINSLEEGIFKLNAKLKQVLKEYKFKFIKLEQNDKDTALENAKFKARVAKFEQK